MIPVPGKKFERLQGQQAQYFSTVPGDSPRAHEDQVPKFLELMYACARFIEGIMRICEYQNLVSVI